MRVMAEAPERKLFLGVRLKRLRRDLGLTQTRMAEDLGISPSYLNHLERNQRPLTAQVLLRLAQTYDIDVRSLSSDADAAGARDLAEVLADPLFRDLAIPRHEMTEVAQEAPGVADALVRLYRAYSDRRRLTDLGVGGGPTGLGAESSPAPSDWVRDFIQGQRNFFPELDEMGEALAAELNPEPQGFAAAARLARLAEGFVRHHASGRQIVGQGHLQQTPGGTVRRSGARHHRGQIAIMLQEPQLIRYGEGATRAAQPFREQQTAPVMIVAAHRVGQKFARHDAHLNAMLFAQ